MSAFEQWLAANGGGSAQQGGSSFDAWLAANGAPRQKAPNVLDAKEYEAQVKARALEEAPGFVSSLAYGVGKGFGSSMLEGQQLIGRGLDTVGAGRIGKWLIDDAKSGMRKLDGEIKPYRDANPSTTGVGEFGGNVVASFAPMGAATKLMPAYSTATTLGKVGIAAGQGAAGSVLNPVRDTQTNGEYWSEKGIDAGIGAGLGGALSAVAPYAGSVAKGIWNNAAGVVQPIIQPEKYVGRGIVGILSEQDAAKAAQNIRGAKKYVEGSLPTTAQIAGLPELVQTEKAAGNFPAFRTELTNRQIANNQARWDSLNGVAGSELDLKNAVAKREAGTEPLYRAVKGEFLEAPSNGSLLPLLETPYFSEAMKRAQKLSLNSREGKLFTDAEYYAPSQPAVSRVVEDINWPASGASVRGGTSFNRAQRPALSGPSNTPIAQGEIAPFASQAGTDLAVGGNGGRLQNLNQAVDDVPQWLELVKTKGLSGRSAHYIKMALDDMLDEHARKGIAGFENRALQDIRGSYLDWLNSSSPNYAKATGIYRELSPHINGMQAAQGMAESLGGMGRALDASGAPMLSPSGYAAALKRAKRSLEFGMHPNQETALDAIGKDLQRSTVSNSIRTSGSDTGYNLSTNGWLANKLYGSGFEGASPVARTIGGVVGGLGLGGPLGAIGGGVSSLVGGQKVGQMVSEPLQKSLAHLMMNPESLLPYLDAKAGAGAFPSVGLKAPPNAPWMDYLRQGASPGLLSLLGGQ